MTAVGCPLPAGHCHSERSEESRCLSLVISMPINTSRREEHQTIRRQTSENSILERKRDNPAAFGGIQNLSPPKGWQRNWIRRGAKRPENPVTCFPVEKRLTTFSALLCSCKMCSLCTPKGETTHYILRVASAPTAVTDSLDFRVADAPLQIQFA